MVCEHLAVLERALIGAGVRETARGALWSQHCREWVYFDVVLHLAAIRATLMLPDCVVVHENLDPRSGLERGLVCTACDDAVMGRLDGAPAFP